MLNYKQMSREKIYSLLFAFYISALPLIAVNPAFFNPYEYPKFVTLTVGVFVLFIGFLMLGLRHGKTRLHLPHKLLLLLSVALVVSDMFGLDPRVSLLGSQNRLQGFVTFFSGVLLFFLVSLWAQIDPKFKKYCVYGLIYSAVTISVFAILQFLLLVVFKNQSIPNFDGRVIGTLGNPDFLGGFIALIFPIALFAGRNSSLGIYLLRNVKILALVLFSLAILFSQSRSATLSVLITCLVVFFLFFKKKKFGMVASAGTLVTFLAVLYILPQRFSVWDSRTLIWSEGVKAFLKRPLIGYGQENFELVFPKNYHFHVDSAHNIFLELTVAGGIISLVLFIAFFIFLFKRARLDTGLVFIAFLITASFNPISISQWVVFWVISGFVCAFPNKAKNSSQ